MSRRVAALALGCLIALTLPSCNKKAPPPDTIVVQSFEGWVNIQAWPKQGKPVEIVSTWASEGKRSLAIAPGMMAAFKDLATHDFSPYHKLLVDAHNPSDDTLLVGFEVQDDHTDFMDRHQRTTAAPPGDHTLVIDLEGGLQRGEEGRPYRGSEKTPIHLTDVTRLGFMNRGKGTLYLDNLRLIKEPPLTCPSAFAFDFGPKGSRVMGKTIGVNEETRYDPARGFGLLAGEVKTVRGPMSYPTPLLGDGLALPEGGFRVDLPAGKYIGWIAFERGGFWEGDAASYTHAQLTVNGEVAHEHASSPDAAHFLFQDTEVTDLREIADKLILPAHAAARFSFYAREGQNVFSVVADGQAKDAPKLRTAGLVIAPDTSEGRAFMDAHLALQKKAIAEAFVPRDLARRGRDRKAISEAIEIEPIEPGEPVYPGDRPRHAHKTSPKLVGVPGQRVTAALVLYAMEARSARLMPLSPLPSWSTPRALQGRYLPARPMEGGSAWIAVHHYRPDPDITLGPELCRPVLIEIPIPKDATPGHYNAHLVIFSGPSVTLDVTLPIHVVRDEMAKIPLSVGLLGSALPFGPEVVGEERWWALQEALLVEQAAYGLNTITGGPGLDYEVRTSATGLTIEAPRALRYFAIARKLWHGRTVVPYGGFLPALSRLRHKPSDLAKALVDFQKVHDVPEHLFYAYDEPSTPEEMKQAIAKTGLYRAAGVPTLGFTSARKGDALFDELMAVTTAPALNEHEPGDVKALMDKGHPVWIYNNGLSRYGLSVHLYRQHLLGVRGRLEWIGLLTQGFAFDELDGREPFTGAWVVHKTLGIMPTPRWLAAREGLVDLAVFLAFAPRFKEDHHTTAWGVERYQKDKESWSDKTLAEGRTWMLERLDQRP